MFMDQLYQSRREIRPAQLFSCLFRTKWRILGIFATCTFFLLLQIESWTTAGREISSRKARGKNISVQTVPRLPSGTVSQKNCQQWLFDEPNWTLIYNNTFGKCKALPSKSKVKRILFPNRTILFRGCTKTTKRCSEKPHYSRRLRTRINTPPCCLLHVLEIFQHLSVRLQKAKITYYLVGGGLIGWYRNGRMVPYDHDLDFFVDFRSWKSKKVKKIVTSLANAYGYAVESFKWNKIKIFYSKSNRMGMDLWPYRVKKRHGKPHLKIFSSLYKQQKYKNVFPLRTTTLNGIKTFVPNDPYTVLNADYGKNGSWVKELLCTRKDRFGNCVS